MLSHHSPQRRRSFLNDTMSWSNFSPTAVRCFFFFVIFFFFFVLLVSVFFYYYYYYFMFPCFVRYTEWWKLVWINENETLKRFGYFSNLSLLSVHFQQPRGLMLLTFCLPCTFFFFFHYLGTRRMYWWIYKYIHYYNYFVGWYFI